MTLPKMLVVDDEKDIRDVLGGIFSSEFEMQFARDGLEALEKARGTPPDLVLLDIVMPRMDGFQTCLRLRQQEETRQTPIIFLTTKNEPQTETFGLDLGADDFVTKPFNAEVLRSRVKRRLARQTEVGTGEKTELGEYTIQWDRQEAVVGDRQLSLTTKEINLLRLFVQNPGKVLSRETILERVWSDTFITDRTIDSHVKELRKKLPPLVQKLKTVYGAGYRLDI